MAGLVLIALVVLAIVFVAVSKNKKRAMLISVGVIGVYHLYVSTTCGPNRADVKVMKPMAEKISEYIVKNGIPESLQDIPNLPYGLEGCERKVEYSKFNSHELITEKVDSKEKADFYHISEKCNFVYKSTLYYIELDEGISKEIKNGGGGSIDIGNKTSHTWASLSFDLNSTGNIIMKHDFSFVNSKNTGICNPMRQ